MQHSDGSHARKPQQATSAEFIAALTPCLVLVAPVGMDADAKEVWFDAARLALADVSGPELKRAAVEAAKVADHPSKIVPAIMKAVAADRERRRQWDSPPRTAPYQLTHKPAPIPFEETQAILRAAGFRAAIDGETA